MAYVGMIDLLKRWVYSRRGVEKLMHREDFPPPAFTVNAGHTKVWALADIDGYEARHPEMTNREAKRRKVAGFAAAIGKKRKAG